MTEARKPIHPSQIDGPPFCFKQIDDMVESWRGTPRGNVPQEVKVMAWMLNQYCQAIESYRMLDEYVQVVQDQFERDHQNRIRRLDALRDDMGVAALRLDDIDQIVRSKKQRNKAPPKQRATVTT